MSVPKFDITQPPGSLTQKVSLGIAVLRRFEASAGPLTPADAGRLAGMIEELWTDRVAQETERCAKIADAAADEASRIAMIHSEDSQSRYRMFARAREARQIAISIREGDA